MTSAASSCTMGVMPSEPIDVTTKHLADLAPRARVLPLVSHVTWSLRKTTRDDSVAAYETLRSRLEHIAAVAAVSGVLVEDGGIARITAGTSGKYTGVVVLVTAPQTSSRVVILPLE